MQSFVDNFEVINHRYFNRKRYRYLHLIPRKMNQFLDRVKALWSVCEPNFFIFKSATFENLTQFFCCPRTIFRFASERCFWSLFDGECLRSDSISPFAPSKQNWSATGAPGRLGPGGRSCGVRRGTVCVAPRAVSGKAFSAALCGAVREDFCRLR